jgi:chorismate mutase/prephenate dehydratase
MKTCLETPQSAAIGFADTGKKMGLKILAENIQNRSDNTTRFFVLSKGETYSNKRQAGSTTRSTLVFTLEDKPGSLLSILEIFREASINMCHIESRRTPLPEWNYYFFITLETQLDSQALEEPLKKVEKLTPWNRFLGQYPVLL